MGSSEEDDDFPSIESVTPQDKIDTIYQSKTEKGIRKICFELLDLKDAVENLCGNNRSKYLAFLRLSEEVVETKHELNELRKHISTQGILLHDLTNGLCRDFDEWSRDNGDIEETQETLQNCKLEDPFPNEEEKRQTMFLEHIDILLAEHKVEEAIDAIDDEEKSYQEMKGPVNGPSTEMSSYKSAILERKAMLEKQLVEITEQHSMGTLERKKALASLLKLGKGPLAHQLLLKSYGSQLEKSIEAFLPLCLCYPETNSATLSNLVFSMISLTTKESNLLFGDNPVYSNKLVQWAEQQVEYFVRLVKEHAPSSETILALRAISVCVQASLNHCSALEPLGLKLSKLLLVLLQPFVEEVLELNFRRARKTVLDFGINDENLPLSPRLASPLSTFAMTSDSALVDSGKRFIFVVNDIVQQLTDLVILHFGGNILHRISLIFDKYVDALIKALPALAEDDNLAEVRDDAPFRAETDAEQLALLGTAFTVVEELLPMVVSRIWSILNESKEAGSMLVENIVSSTSNAVEFKDWRRLLQHSLDKLRDYFCRQYVLNFIYSRDGEARLDAQIYLGGEGEDLFRDSNPLPSLPIQALFGKLQQLAAVAGDVLHGREKIQKILLARLTETVVMWLSDEQEFWDVLEDDSAPFHPVGLQQLILDMHFTVEIARFAGYPSRHVQQIASSIIARALRTFPARGKDQQIALPEDEWFGETAKAAINKLLLGASGSDTSEIDEERIMINEDHIIIPDDVISDSDDSPSSLSTVEGSESFASAENGELDSPMYLTDAES